jgi:hypothetical protein
MLTDSQKHIRELAARRLLKARKMKTNSVRLFKLPKINFNASSYIDLIDWKNVTDPSIFKTTPDEDIQLFFKQEGEGEISLLRLPCHTQAVERAVKAVTEASGILYNNADKEGFIKSQIESRKVTPKFDSKKDFVTT